MKEIKYLPESSPGTRRFLEIIRYGTPGARPKVYLQAGLHADEAPSYVVLFHLRKLLDQAEVQGDIKGEIIVVPAANPIGLSQWRNETLQGRFDSASSINFNRNHQDLAASISDKINNRLSGNPETNVELIRTVTRELLEETTPTDEAEALKLLLYSLSHDSDIVLDLHCDLDALLHLYLGTPLWPDGADLAAYLGAEAVLLASDSGGTPFDEANSRLWWNLAETFPNFPIPPACFSATVELRGAADTDISVARQDANNLYSFLQNRGAVAGIPAELPTLRYEATPLTGVDYIKATSPGIVSYLKKVGETVEKDEVVAAILNPLAEDEAQRVIEIKSKTEGILFSRNIDRFARPGRIIAKVAGKKPLREESGHLLTQ